MNKIFKKLLSTVLSVSFLSVSTISLSALADYCARNPKGGCVNSIYDKDLANVMIHKTADFADVKNLGKFGNAEHCIFNLRALDEVFDKKKLISAKDLKDQLDLLDQKCEVLSDKCKNLPIVNCNNRNILYTICASLIGSVAGLFTFLKAKNPTSNQDKKSIFNKNSQDPKPKQTSKSSHSTVKAVFSTLLGGLIGGLASIIGIIGLKNKSENDKLENDDQDICEQSNEVCEQSSKTKKKYYELVDENRLNSGMLGQLLYFLEHPETMIVDNDHDPNDVFYCHTNDPEDKYEEKAYTCYPTTFGFNYTKEEKESFPQKFKEVAAKIRKNLEENQKYL